LDRLQGQSIKPARLEQALVAQRSAWLRTSRPGGVADALGRLKPRTAAER
jgi:hypothetical protein